MFESSSSAAFSSDKEMEYMLKNESREWNFRKNA